MTTMGTIDGSVLPSDGLHALGALVDNLARQGIINAHGCDAASAVFDALRATVAQAIAKVAAEWNTSHDLLRFLPPEVLEQCFAILPVSDRCGLSLVCSRWRDTVTKLPGVWNSLVFKAWKPDAISWLWERSGQLPLDLVVGRPWDPESCDDVLRCYAPRLRRLELHWGYKKICGALRFPVPQLEKLSLSTETCRIVPMLFDQHAPRLHTLRLTNMDVPAACPAFASVKFLTLEGISGSLRHVFEVMPYLEHLELDKGKRLELPTFPIRSSLRLLRVSYSFIEVKRLYQLGYHQIDALIVVETASYFMCCLGGGVNLLPELASTIRLRANWWIDLEVLSGQRIHRFSGESYRSAAFEELLSAPYLHPITCIVLPILFDNSTCCVRFNRLLSHDNIVDLPALHTLTLECGRICAEQYSISLYESIMPGAGINAPRLARINVVRAPEAASDAPIESVSTAHLVSLLENVLVGDDRSSLELFIDTPGGITLDGDLDELRECIGSLFI